MSKPRGWLWVCNGGPNDTNVGGDATSLGAAMGALEHAMKNLNATRGSVFRKDGLSYPLPVASEAEAGTDGGVSE